MTNKDLPLLAEVLMDTCNHLHGRYPSGSITLLGQPFALRLFTGILDEVINVGDEDHREFLGDLFVS